MTGKSCFEQLNLKNKVLPILVQPHPKKECHMTMSKKKRPLFKQIAPKVDHIRKIYVTVTKKETYISSKVQLQNHSSTFIHKNKSIFQLPVIKKDDNKVFRPTQNLTMERRIPISSYNYVISQLLQQKTLVERKTYS